MAFQTRKVSVLIMPPQGAPSHHAVAFLTLVENFMNIGYLWLVHAQGSPAAPLLGFASALMTLSKTALYWLIEYYCGGCSIMHNDLQTLVAYWVLPMGYVFAILETRLVMSS